MNTYFEARNNDDIVQIDDKYQNISFLSKHGANIVASHTGPYQGSLNRYDAHIFIGEKDKFSCVIPNQKLLSELKAKNITDVSFAVASAGGFNTSTNEIQHALTISLDWHQVARMPGLIMDKDIFKPYDPSKPGFEVYCFGTKFIQIPEHGVGLAIWNGQNIPVYYSGQPVFKVSAGKYGVFTARLGDILGEHDNPLEIPLFDGDGLIGICPSIYPAYVCGYNPQYHEMGTFGYSYTLTGSPGNYHTKITLKHFPMGASTATGLDGVGSNPDQKFGYIGLYIAASISQDMLDLPAQNIMPASIEKLAVQGKSVLTEEEWRNSLYV